MADTDWADCRWAHMHPQQCRRAIYKRDCLRRTGRSKSGFQMHYTNCQCSRKAKIKGYCTQHARELGVVYEPAAHFASGEGGPAETTPDTAALGVSAARGEEQPE